MKKKSPWYKLIGNDTNKVASNSQKKKLFFLLVFFSVFVILAFAHNYYYNIIQPKSYSQFWPNNEKIALDYENAPFWFKHENDSIFVDRTLSDSLRKQIYKLVPDTLKAKSAFYQAVNNLTFKSQPNTGDSIFIVYACGLIAVIGVTIRSLYDFIGNASYKNELNINRWWPWYYLRPFIGFLSGAAFYFLYDGGVLELNVQGTSASKLYLMLGLCCLIGFGLNDFIERLRIVSKAIFGVKDN